MHNFEKTLYSCTSCGLNSPSQKCQFHTCPGTTKMVKVPEGWRPIESIIFNEESFKLDQETQIIPHPKMGNKSDSKKPPITIIPREALEQEAQAFAFGAGKYGKYNFRKGIEYTRLLDAVMRHTLAFSDGEDKDPESGESHLAHARANLAMLLYMIKSHPELDDRYKPE